MENLPSQSLEVTKLLTLCIDVTLTKGLENPLVNWSVDRNFNASDHDTILSHTVSSPNPDSFFRNFKKADWESLSTYLSECNYYTPEMISRKNIDQMVQCLEKRLNTALDKACPLVKRRFKKGKIGW